MAVVLPLIFDELRKYFPPVAGTFTDKFRWVIRYLVLAVASTVIGLIIYVQWRNGHPGTALDPTQGFLLGFSGESTIEKAFRPKVTG